MEVTMSPCTSQGKTSSLALNLPLSQSPDTSSSSSSSPIILTPPSPTQLQKIAQINMGPCSWRDGDGWKCPCESGSCVSDLDALLTASCDYCAHDMSMHVNYTTNPEDLTMSAGPVSRVLVPYDIPPHIIPRATFVDELIARVHHYQIIRVNGTPASGKTTTMGLLVNRLLENHGQTMPIHVITGWDRNEVQNGWAAHLEQKTGVHGRKWLNYPAYLLLDEAQQSYWDGELWAEFFKSVEPGRKPFIVLFMSYGSPDGGYAGYDDEYMPTPMTFSTAQQILLRPAKDVKHSSSLWRPVGLLLEEDEAMDVVTRYASTLQLSLSLTHDLKKGFFLTSNGHVGLLTGITRLLRDMPELHNLARRGITIDWRTASQILFNNPLDFFQYIRGYPFTRGLPRPRVLQDNASARVLKMAVASNGIYESNLKAEALKTLKRMWRMGWFHAEESNHDIHYVFASQIHRWYCHFLFTEVVPDSEINYSTPLQLVIDVITRFQPRQLSDAERSLTGDSLPLEDQYQKEFYRCLFPILDGHLIMSPEFVIRAGIKGGTIDFLIARKKWGIELLRDRDRPVEHMKRFQPDGQYFSLIESGDMEQYIVLDFTTTPPKKPRPEYHGHLYHVVFSRNYREVEVIDASDLSVVRTFALMENASPVMP